jgi:hypothetical protein
MPEGGSKRMPGGLASNIKGESKQMRRWKSGQGALGPVTQCVAMQRIWCNATRGRGSEIRLEHGGLDQEMLDGEFTL